MPTQFSRRDFLRLCAITGASVLTGCGIQPNAPATAIQTPIPTPTAEPAAVPTPVATVMPGAQPTRSGPPAPSVSLDLMIAQMIMVGFRGLTLSEDNPIVANIRDQQIGGVFLFDTDHALGSPVRNIQSPQQVRTLTNALRSLARGPLLIATDQEGGAVARLDQRHGFPPTVSAQSLGKTNDLAATHAAAAQMAKTLAQAGLNFNLAPVVDVNVNPNNPIIGKLGRSFSANPTIVGAHALEFVKAHREANVLCALKHFPGHGSSHADSHLGFVDVTTTWSEKELEPYRALLKAGVVDAVMTAHIFNARLDPNFPATLSRLVLTGILREQLGYEGVIITDDMDMKAISDYYGFERAVQLAVEAGADILSFANQLVYHPDAAARAMAALAKLVEAGTLSAARIEQSYQRITRLKARLANPKPG